MIEKINKLYEENNYPSAPRLYKILRDNDIKITMTQVKEFLEKKEEVQLTKIVVNKNSSSIIAYYPFEFVNLDIYVLDKYTTANKGYKYILCMIDIFSRFVNAIPLKHKNKDTVLKAFQEIIKENGIIPTNIISDSDSSFLSSNFQDYMNKENINLNTVAINDHHALGVIDRFALTLKRILTKKRIISKSANWVDELDKVIKIYNNTEHSALLRLTPAQALEKKFFEFVQQINHKKSLNNHTISDLEKGDKVRILEKKTFKKGSEAIWSSKIYIVESSRGKTVYLDNGEKKKRDQLLKVHNSTESGGETIDDKYAKQNRIKRRNNIAGVDENNIITQKRH